MAILSAEGEEIGEELLARFLLLRGIIGEMVANAFGSCLLFHSSLSFGEAASSSGIWLHGSKRSLQSNRVTGVALFPIILKWEGVCSFRADIAASIPLPPTPLSAADSSLESLYRNLFSFFFVTSDTGIKFLEFAGCKLLGVL